MPQTPPPTQPQPSPLPSIAYRHPRHSQSGMYITPPIRVSHIHNVPLHSPDPEGAITLRRSVYKKNTRERVAVGCDPCAGAREFSARMCPSVTSIGVWWWYRWW